MWNKLKTPAYSWAGNAAVVMCLSSYLCTYFVNLMIRGKNNSFEIPFLSKMTVLFIMWVSFNVCFQSESQVSVNDTGLNILVFELGLVLCLFLSFFHCFLLLWWGKKIQILNIVWMQNYKMMMAKCFHYSRDMKEHLRKIKHMIRNRIISEFSRTTTFHFVS